MLDNQLNTENRIVVGFARHGRALPVIAGNMVKHIGKILNSNDISDSHKYIRCKKYIDHAIPKVIDVEIKLPDLSEEVMSHILEEYDFARVEILMIKDQGNGPRLQKFILPLNKRDSIHTGFEKYE